jgi:hypothetical protein
MDVDAIDGDLDGDLASWCFADHGHALGLGEGVVVDNCSELVGDVYLFELSAFLGEDGQGSACSEFGEVVLQVDHAVHDVAVLVLPVWGGDVIDIVDCVDGLQLLFCDVVGDEEVSTLFVEANVVGGIEVAVPVVEFGYLQSGDDLVYEGELPLDEVVAVDDQDEGQFGVIRGGSGEGAAEVGIGWQSDLDAAED